MAVAIALLQVAWSLILVSSLGLAAFALFPRLLRVIPIWIGAPVIGLGLLQILGWYWLEQSEAGLLSGLIALAVLAGGAGLFGIWRIRGSLRVCRPSRATTCALVLGCLVAIVATFQMAGFLSADRPSAATFGNNDIASYALFSDHLIDNGFHSTGSVQGADQGGVSAIDASGVRIVLTSVSIVTGSSVEESLAASLILLMVILGLGLFWFAGAVLGDWGPIAAACVLLAIVPSGFSYLLGNYFLSQVGAMAGIAVLLGIGVCAFRLEAAVDRLALGIVGALALAPVLLTYPHMGVLGTVVVFGTAFLGRPARGFVRRSLRLAGVASISLLGSLVLLAPHIPALVERARLLSKIEAGWTLPLSSPGRILGFEKFGAVAGLSTPTTLMWWGQFLLLLLAVVCASVLLYRSKSMVGVVLSALPVIVIVGYRVIVMQRGSSSYGQWKWITFFQPFVIVCVAVALAVLIRTACDQISIRRFGAVAVMAPLISWFIASFLISSSLFRGAWIRIPEGLPALSRLNETNLESVNIDLSPYWESMWAAYFLNDLEVHVMNPSYYSRSFDPNSWTVIGRSAGVHRPHILVPDSSYGLSCSERACVPLTIANSE